MRAYTQNFSALLEVLNIKSKIELDRYCKTLTIQRQDFSSFIIAAQHGLLSPYRYSGHHNKITPDHLHPTVTDNFLISGNAVGTLHEPKAKKFGRKIFQLFHERRIWSTHLLYTPDRKYWHLFYFDNRDIAETLNHWKHGPHIHYVSDLYSDHSIDDVWNSVITGDFSFARKLHIRFRSH